MRILIAHEAAAGGGGVESYLAAVIPALVERGHTVALIHQRSLRQPGPTRLRFDGVPQFSVEDDGFDTALQRLAAWQPDVCFSHNMGALDVDAALLARWPTIKMMHGFFGTCISSHKAHAFPSVVPCSRVFGPACVALYVPRRCGPLRPLKAAASLRWNVRQRGMLDGYATIVVASRYMRDEYLRHGVASDRVVAAPLFPTTQNTDGARFPPREPTVLFAGRMTALKGPRVLVEAEAAAGKLLGRVPRLVMEGDGPERAALIGAASALGVPASFPGWVTGSALAEAFQGASVIAIPSLWPEPFGLVGLEAGLHGVPAIAFASGGIPEWLQDGVNGHLVRERGSAAALGAALASVLGNPESMRALGAGALATASRMTLDNHVQRLEATFVSAAATAGAA